MNNSVTLLPKEKRRMPPSFQPHQFSVVIGKGKDARRAPGTRRLRLEIERHVKEYHDATRRLDKAMVVSAILYRQQLLCPMGGAFVKFDGEYWWEVSEHDARENITASFRNRLHENYKSSSKYKSAKRRSQQKAQLKEESKQQVPTKTTSLTSLPDRVGDEIAIVSGEEEGEEMSSTGVLKFGSEPRGFSYSCNPLHQNRQTPQSSNLDTLRSLPIMCVDGLYSLSLIEPFNAENGEAELLEPVDPNIFDFDTIPTTLLRRQTTASI